jgi:hypothetical protein
VVFDPRVAEKVKASVSLGLDRVWFDTAVSLLVEPTELDWVWMDNIVYVTSKENAKLRREQQKIREQERVRMLREAASLKELGLTERGDDPLAGPPREAPPPKPDQQPLVNVLQDLARSSGMKLVFDPRIGEKAKGMVPSSLPSVPPATAVRLLADMAGLRAVPFDKVIYITTRENAGLLQETTPDKGAAKPIVP